MIDLNKVQLIGRLGRDPESRHMPSGKAVTNFSIATSESWKDKETGDKKEKTEWHNIVAFDKAAELLAEYLRKGSQVYIEGKLQTRKWLDKEGKDHYSTEIIVQQFQFLGGKPEVRQPEARQVTPAVDGGAPFNDDVPW